ncbi:glucokinase [Rhodobaculum claviforme]|uniref:Glucokinase n=1 Tax=Rhodobaculum claviforme TaxID=1549854 RepID=A0A934TLX7_9RHOB|nr:glucokinase [Rhodobaculum claviforme]MBK5928240.1 hypothetical protein [Rhodobaculum claviforme]
MDDFTDARAPILVADIGGTNMRLALARDGRLLEGSVTRHPCAGWRDPMAPMAAYLGARGVARVGGVCVAVAGPVRDGIARMTNLAWEVDAGALSDRFGGVRAVVLNDLQAQGHALDHLAPGSLRPVIAVARRAPGPRLVIGVGTGFNAAVVHDTPSGRLVTASEAGHATLPAPDPQIAALAGSIATAGLRPEIEEALSGRGLSRIDAFLGHGGRPAPEITAAGPGPTLALFARLLGVVAGDLALVHLPWGGVYLVGGMARAVAPQLADGGFATALRDRGRFAPLLAGLAVDLLEDDHAALAGCAALMQGGGAV